MRGDEEEAIQSIREERKERRSGKRRVVELRSDDRLRSDLYNEKERRPFRRTGAVDIRYEVVES